jgi:hypothetical protein
LKFVPIIESAFALFIRNSAERPKFAAGIGGKQTPTFQTFQAKQNAVEARNAGKKRSGRCLMFPETVPKCDNLIWLSLSRKRLPSLFQFLSQRSLESGAIT